MERETAQSKNRKNHPEIHKLAADFSEVYGDGRGGGLIEYPVYFCHKLVLSKGVRRRMARTLRAMDACRRDVQSNRIVHDVIDPSFNALILSDIELKEMLLKRGYFTGTSWRMYLLHRNEQYVYHSITLIHGLIKHWKKTPTPIFRSKWDGTKKRWTLDAHVWRKEVLKHIKITASKEMENTAIPWIHFSKDMEEAVAEVESMLGLGSGDSRNSARIAHWNMQSKRCVFQWVPTLVHCGYDEITRERTAAFLGNIAGLPDRKVCTSLYSDLELVLSKMLPMLAMVPFPINILNNGTLQVIVKAQRYVIPPQSTYTGRWHTEGFSENIVAVGVYYVDVGTTTGGALSFRPVETPSKYYFEHRRTDEEGYDNGGDGAEADDHWWSHYVRDIPIDSRTAAVFSNTIAHRFRTIRNDTDKPQERLFVNFFFVCPSKPLPMTTSSAPSRSQIRDMLSQKGVKEPQIHQAVMNFVEGYDTADSIHRKVVRDGAREAMAGGPRWATLDYGNAGVVRFTGNHLPDFETGWQPQDVHDHSDVRTSALGSAL